MTERPWLIDTSALVRLGSRKQSTGWDTQIQRGRVHIATVTLLEVGYSARSGDDHQAALKQPPLSLMPVEYLTPGAEERAIDVQRQLARRGHHRAPSIPDLIVAALAEQADLVVLHVDKDFGLIAAITGQAIQRLD